MIPSDFFFDISELGFDGRIEEARRLKFKKSVLFDESARILESAFEAYENGREEEYMSLMKKFYEIRSEEAVVANKLLESIVDEIKKRK